MEIRNSEQKKHCAIKETTQRYYLEVKMYLFIRKQILLREKLYIPYFMRASLQIHDNSVLTLSSGIRKTSPYQNQLIISSIQAECRADFWNLKASFRDRPGIVAELMNLLARENIHLLETSIATRDSNDEFVIDLNFCAKGYKSEFDGDTFTRRNNAGQWPKELYARIVAMFIKDLVFRPDGKPIIYVKHNHVLADSIDKVNHIETCLIKNGLIRLPKGVISAIRSQFVEQYPSVANAANKPYAILTTDLEFRLILATIIFINTGHVHVRVEAKNTTNTLSVISRTLFEHGFNIIQFSARNIGSGAKCLIDIFMHLPPEKDKYKSDKRIEKWVESIFRGTVLQKLECSVSFPPTLSLDEIKIDTAKQ